MSLFKQIQFLISILLITAIAVVMKINFNNAKDFSANQLFNNSKNTANVLALSISQNTSDPAFIETSINAMFDGGYYEEISLNSQDGKTIYKRVGDVKIEGVPDFFIKLIDLKSPLAKAQVMNGWTQFGELKVKGHPGTSYIKLWETFKNICITFFIIGTIAVFTGRMILKYILKSLTKIQHQAEAVLKNEFIIEKKLPGAPELKNVVIAINSMVEKVENIYERQLQYIKDYNNLNFKDSSTGLFNRKYLLQKLTQYTGSESEKAAGEILMICLKNTSKISISLGHPIIKEFLINIGRILQEEIKDIPDSIPCALRRYDFAIVLPNTSHDKTDLIAEKIVKNILNAIKGEKEVSNIITIHCGISSYIYKDDPGTILSKSDYALSVAKTMTSGGIHRFLDEKEKKPMPGKTEWKKIIEEALEKRNFFMTAQPVLHGEKELHKEIYINLMDKTGHQYKAGYFMPMVITLGMADKLDRYVLESSADYISKNKNSIFAVNITTDFCKDRIAYSWLRTFLNSNKELKNNLLFEFQESTLLQLPEICLDIAGLLKGMEFKFGIDQFTMNATSINIIKKLKPDYIKIEVSYLLDKEDQSSKDIALNALLTITDSLGIKFIATKVESLDEKETLLSKNITYFQGQEIAEPIPLGYKNEL